MELSYQDINDFFIEKGIGNPCPTCKQDTIYILADKGKLIPLNILTASELEGYNLKEIVKYVAIVCNNCGATTLFLLNIIKKWKKTKSLKS